ncbi:T-cell receptor alpha chain V region CTL-L17 [Sciurus carolinensis]|nr:T-cell receptor alpha chain V region CTL-L17 [Sciurus carolinensis]
MQRRLGALLGLLWVQVCWVSRGEKVEQHPSILSVQEGDSAVINCTYSDSTSSYFPWYKQEAGKGPQRIIDIHSTKEMNQIQRLIVVLNKRAKHFFLNITATQPGDSAVYFCAASAQCFPDTCSLYSNHWAATGLSRTCFFCHRLSSITFIILFVCKWKLAL